MRPAKLESLTSVVPVADRWPEAASFQGMDGYRSPSRTSCVDARPGRRRQSAPRLVARRSQRDIVCHSLAITRVTRQPIPSAMLLSCTPIYPGNPCCRACRACRLCRACAVCALLSSNDSLTDRRGVLTRDANHTQSGKSGVVPAHSTRPAVKSPSPERLERVQTYRPLLPCCQLASCLSALRTNRENPTPTTGWAQGMTSFS